MLHDAAKHLFKYMVMMFGIAFFIFLISTVYIKMQDPPEIEDLVAIKFYTDDGSEFFELNNNQKKNWIRLEDISPHMLEAIIAIEDKHFYEHNGFDFKRIVKALMENARSMSKKYGASTITQQYAKNLYLTPEKSYIRKAKEAYYTVLLEDNYSKDEILEGYLNTIYFGHGIYGVEDASLFYFGKSASELSISESAILASIPKSPTYYSPIANFDNNQDRKRIVLIMMLEDGFIDKQEYNKSLAKSDTIIGKSPHSSEDLAPYYQDVVVNELQKLDIKEDHFYKGLKVYTTLDQKLHKIARNTVDKVYPDHSSIQSAVYAIDPKTGYVKTLIGGRDYLTSQYNRAVSSTRHPGSTIKPLLYYSALEYGFTPTTTFRSEDTTFYLNTGEQYHPTNYAELYANKDITMALALAVSDNIYAVKTHLFLGQDVLPQTASRLGITTEMEPLPSLALGATGVHLSELTTAYAHFANYGRKVEPVYITKVTDLDGKVLYEHQPDPSQVLNPDLSFMMNHMMTSMFDPNMNDYIGVTGMQIYDDLTHKYAGKSGSTDDDNWMIGYNPELVVGVWTGYDDNTDLQNEENQFSKYVWQEVMEDYFIGEEIGWFTPTDNVVGVPVNPNTGELATPRTRYSKIMYYLENTVPYS
ncbi:transglycosylase domain-containing protein [Haloplasma contractile]|uniref:Penicillin-binding protein 2D n=1 Tax=Haloplasma contractile SSD-17B TaxID=1033810 RepID=U2DYM0_9MOLU|nr:PBP1A family penicillin-binding protein [Haloplasma contractile]ERJ13347.1 Penicillin-binding protein 2D [Haloplasma contractile SSD-17B]